jgi:hypothetical protein
MMGLILILPLPLQRGKNPSPKFQISNPKGLSSHLETWDFSKEIYSEKEKRE